MKNEKFCDRISQLVDYYGSGRNTNFANLINVTESNVRSWLNNTLPKVDIVEKIARNCEGLSLDWLVLGEGSMLNTTTLEQPSNTIETPLDSTERSKMLDTISTQAHIIERLQLKIESLERLLSQNEA